MGLGTQNTNSPKGSQQAAEIVAAFRSKIDVGRLLPETAVSGRHEEGPVRLI